MFVCHLDSLKIYCLAFKFTETISQSIEIYIEQMKPFFATAKLSMFKKNLVLFNKNFGFGIK